MNSPFETRSKYFHNPNSWFANAFSNMTVVVVCLLVGFVLLIWGAKTCFKIYYENCLISAVHKQMHDYGFTVKGLSLESDETKDRSSETRVMWFLGHRVWHPTLNNGSVMKDRWIYVTIRYWGDGSKPHVEDFLIRVPPDDSLVNWITYNPSR